MTLSFFVCKLWGMHLIIISSFKKKIYALETENLVGVLSHWCECKRKVEENETNPAQMDKEGRS